MRSGSGMRRPIRELKRLRIWSGISTMVIEVEEEMMVLL